MKITVEFIQGFNVENMFGQYENNQKSVRTYQAYKPVTLT